MAKIGLSDFRYGVATEASDGTITYATPKKPGKAISFNFDPTKSDASLYADDVLAEHDSSVTGGTCTMGIDREDPTTYAELLGHTTNDGEVVSNTNDIAPYVGLGRVATLLVDGTYKYRATFFAKVQFSEPSEENNTRGESVEFGTYELEGVVAVPVDGDWRKYKTFDTKAAAIAYLESCFGAESES